MINKKGLDDKKVQELIDNQIKRDREFKETYLPMYVQSEVNRIMFEAIRNIKKGCKEK